MNEWARPWPKRKNPPWLPWTRGFIRDFGFRCYFRTVIIDGNSYRIAYWLKTIRCWLTGGHKWEEHSECVAPDVVQYATGGWDECAGCGRVRNGWGIV